MSAHSLDTSVHLFHSRRFVLLVHVGSFSRFISDGSAGLELRVPSYITLLDGFDVSTPTSDTQRQKWPNHHRRALRSSPQLSLIVAFPSSAIYATPRPLQNLIPRDPQSLLCPTAILTTATEA
eukprot:scaffold75738_cov97-Cyclotella_meneghiniana.AAC.3